MQENHPPGPRARRRRGSATLAYATGISLAVALAVAIFVAVRAAAPGEYVAHAEVVRTAERADGRQTAVVRWRSPEGAPHTRNVAVADELRGRRTLLVLVEERPAARVTVVSERPDRRDDLLVGLVVALVAAAFGALVVASARGFGLLPDLSRPGGARPLSEGRGFYWRS